MKKFKIIAAVAVAALFIALLIISAEGSDATGTWVDGKSGVYYKMVDVDDKDDIAQVYELSSLASICKPNTSASYPFEVKNVTDFTIEVAMTSDIKSPTQKTKQLLNFKGEIEFTGNMNTDGELISYVPEFLEGDMISKINEYFGTISAGEKVTYKGNVDIVMVGPSDYQYQETSTCYVVVSSQECQKISSMYDYTITVGDKSIQYYERNVYWSEIGSNYKFNPALTPSSSKPFECKVDNTVVSDYSCIERHTVINGSTYEMTINDDIWNKSLEGSSRKDADSMVRSNIYVTSNYDLAQITKFKTNADAIEYFDLNGFEYSQDYDTVEKIIDEAYAKDYTSDSGSDSGDKNNGTTLYIIIGAVAAVIVIGLVAAFVIRK